MSIYRLLEVEHVSAFYALDWRDKKLIIRVHPRAWERLCDPRFLSGFSREVRSGQFEFQPFVFPGIDGKSWGFEDSLQTVPATQADEWPMICCVLPELMRSSVTTDPGWRTAYALAASLGVVFDALQDESIETFAELPQCMEVVIRALPCVLCVTLSDLALKGLVPDLHAELMRHTAETAFNLMWTKSGMMSSDFRCWFDGQRAFYLQVPGSATGLGTEPQDYEYGLLLQPHNIDGPLQQLPLLAALAALNGALQSF